MNQAPAGIGRRAPGSSILGPVTSCAPDPETLTDADFDHVLSQVRSFVRTRVLPREREIADADAVPQDLVDAAREMGLFGYAIGPAWGGLGLHVEQEVELLMELAYTSLALRSLVGTNNGIAGQVLAQHGTRAQQDRWLGPIAAGEVVASFALTEDGAGSDPAGLRTRAERDGGDWVITGTKRYITNAPTAGLFLVFARVADDRSDPRSAAGGRESIGAFLVPAGIAGVEVGPRDRKMGQEGAWTADVILDRVRIPADALVGDSVEVGYAAALGSLAKGRLHIAAAAVGQAQRALDESVRHAATATQGGGPIGRFQLVQAMLAEQQVGVRAGRALVRDAARGYRTGEDTRVGPSVAKLYCTEMVGTVADLAVQVHGGSGYMRDTVVERIYRDVRLMRLYEGTSQIQQLIIGRSLVRDAEAVR